MKHWLLRYEAADFENSLFDSSQLSAIRGASLTFLYSAQLVERLIKARVAASARTIYAGASQGAFCFVASEEDARRLKADVVAALARPDAATGCHQHMAYVVSLTEGNDHAALIRAEALCNAAAAQAAHPAFPPFSAEQTKPGTRRDARPALPGKELSLAIADRSAFGRSQRQSFYRNFLGVGASAPSYDFSDEFEEITQGAEKLSQKEPGETDQVARLPLSLHNKMAVFFADGNAFGKHRDKAISRAKDLSGLTELSAALVKHQQELLKGITLWLESHYKPGEENAWFAFDHRDKVVRARFETLMWGGDEMLFVLPSWLALDFANLFFSTVKTWSVDGNPLTFSAGMVICDRKTPIAQAKAVAADLSDAAKLVSKANAPFGQNTLQIEVFEGLSLPENNLDGFRDKLFFHGRPAGSDKEFAERMAQTSLQLTVRGEDVASLTARIFELQAQLPRSQIQKLLDIGSKEGVAHKRTATEENEKGEKVQRDEHAMLVETFNNYLRRAGSESGLKPSDLSVLKPVDGKPASLAINVALIARLWDYVAPVSSSASQGDA